MINLFLPLILGMGVGIDPPQTQSAPAPPVLAVEDIATADLGSGDDLDGARDPEPQIATGKFTTALEVRPILGMTQSSWVGVREYDGQDLVYFTHLMAWRCGLWDIRYGVNGGPADIVVPMEPCNEEFAQPNVMIDLENYAPYVTFLLGFVENISVEIVYDDGGIETVAFDRADVRIP
jgi:hypothetical protein